MSEQGLAFICIGVSELLASAEPVQIALEASGGHPIEAMDEFLETRVQGARHVDVYQAPVLRVDGRVSLDPEHGERPGIGVYNACRSLPGMRARRTRPGRSWHRASFRDLDR